MNPIKKSRAFRYIVYANYAIVLYLFVVGKTWAAAALLILTLIVVWIWNNTDIGGKRHVI